jgi:hypothetical protein
MKARVKRMLINPDAFFYIMQSGTSWKVSKGIPPGARLRGFCLDPYTQALHLFVEHESFPPVEVGTVAPVLDTEFIKV